MYVMKRERNSGITRIKKGKTVAFNIEKSPKNISAFKGHLFPLVMLPANVCEGLPLALSSALVCLPTCFLSPLACCFILYACFFLSVSPSLSFLCTCTFQPLCMCLCIYVCKKKKILFSSPLAEYVSIWQSIFPASLVFFHHAFVAMPSFSSPLSHAIQNNSVFFGSSMTIGLEFLTCSSCFCQFSRSLSPFSYQLVLTLSLVPCLSVSSLSLPCFLIILLPLPTSFCFSAHAPWLDPSLRATSPSGYRQKGRGKLSYSTHNTGSLLCTHTC